MKVNGTTTGTLEPAGFCDAQGTPANEGQWTTTGTLSQQASVQMDHLLMKVQWTTTGTLSQQASVRMDHLLMKVNGPLPVPASRLL